MEPCDKRQKIVDKGVETFRCVNRNCLARGQMVTEEACSLCPVRSFRAMSCKEKSKVQEPPMTDGEIEFLEAVSTEPVSFVEGTPDGGQPPNYPPMSLQVWLYKEALLKWNREGRPTRNAEEVTAILTNHCKKCDWFDADANRCKGCGCKVSSSSIAVMNKIKMATEHCPKGLW